MITVVSRVVVGQCAVQLVGRADRKFNPRLGVEVGQPGLESRRDLVLGQAVPNDVNDRFAGIVTCDACHSTILLGLMAVDPLSEVLGGGLVC